MPPRVWVPVASTNISAARYNPDTLDLDVRFSSGSEYTYSGVPADIAEHLVLASSPTSYLKANIDPLYPYVRTV